MSNLKHEAQRFQNLEHKINHLTTEVAHSDMGDEETRKEFIELIREIRQENFDRFSDGVWRRVNHDLEQLHDHHYNQIAQGILNHLRDGLREEK